MIFIIQTEKPPASDKRPPKNFEHTWSLTEGGCLQELRPN